MNPSRRYVSGDVPYSHVCQRECSEGAVTPSLRERRLISVEAIKPYPPKPQTYKIPVKEKERHSKNDEVSVDEEGEVTASACVV